MKTLRTFAAPIFISIYFLALTWRAVFTYFSPDDTMNLYQSWWSPVAPLIKANLLFFLPSPWPRPLASAWLRSVYSIAGFHPAPFKAMNLAVLVANIFLTYLVARMLSRSRTAAALTTLIIAYHGRAIHLYFDTGYVFDVFSYFFFFGAAIVYLRAREARRFLNWREVAACCVLFVCALNCKEIAVTLPLLLLLYELMYHGDEPIWNSLNGKRWLSLLAIGAIALAVVFGRTLNGSIIREEAYRPVFTWTRYMLTSTTLDSELFFKPNSFTPAMVIGLWVAMAALAWVLRSRALRFAWLFALLSPLPIAFISPRGLSQYYIPLFGWALYAGVLVNLGFGWALDRYRSANPARTRIYASATLLACPVLLLYPLWKFYRPGEPGSVFVEAELNRSIVRQLHRLEPHLGPNSQLMFLDDPIHADWYNLTFLVRLSYHDREIGVHRAKLGASESQGPQNIPASAGLSAYDHVFDYRGGHFRELSAPWNRGAMPAIVIEDGRAQIFHSDWAPVNRDRPAEPGEDLILKAIDLGETLPHLNRGEKFLRDPLATVVSEIRVRVHTLAATVNMKAGWPDETNLYRVDIRVPENVPRGLSWIDITSNGVTGPAIEFPVR